MWTRELRARQFTVLQIQNVIQKLACTHLTAEEVINHVDPDMGTQFLEVRSEGVTTHSCGENPYYIAKHIP